MSSCTLVLSVANKFPVFAKFEEVAVIWYINRPNMPNAKHHTCGLPAPTLSCCGTFIKNQESFASRVPAS